MGRLSFHLLLSCAVLSGCGGGGTGPGAGNAGPGGEEPGGAGGDNAGGSGGQGGGAIALDAATMTTGNGGAAGGGSGGSGGAGGDSSDASGGGGGNLLADAGAASDDGGSVGPAVSGLLPGSTLIFDGKTLDGWDGAANIWSVKDGAIDGLTQNGGQLIVTKMLYDSFRISGQAKMAQSDNHLGVCFWGGRGGHGYGGCVDFVPPSGSIWDYGGGGNVRTLKYVWNGMPVDKHVWNQFEILADAKTGRVRMGVNGHEFMVYQKAGRGRMAVIGLQIHAGFSEVAYKDLAIEVNPTEPRLLSVKDSMPMP